MNCAAFAGPVPDLPREGAACEVLSLAGIERLSGFLRAYSRVLVLTGAGISSGSGIPAYRDAEGRWTRSAPITHQEFIASETARRRYWARSMIGWVTIANARPNTAHLALARLEALGHVSLVLTQNVDGLHQRAGSARVLDLHGRLDTVVCLACAAAHARDAIQAALAQTNPRFANGAGTAAPDGDAQVEQDWSEFVVPRCPDCGGTLKPDVVFYGGSVPARRVEAACVALDAADAMLVIGSSLAAYSGYRFCLRAQAQGKPVVAVNRGRTRADALLQFKIDADCADALTACAQRLAA